MTNPDDLTVDPTALWNSADLFTTKSAQINAVAAELMGQLDPGTVLAAAGDDPYGLPVFQAHMTIGNSVVGGINSMKSAVDSTGDTVRNVASMFGAAENNATELSASAPSIDGSAAASPRTVMSGIPGGNALSPREVMPQISNEVASAAAVPPGTAGESLASNPSDGGTQEASPRKVESQVSKNGTQKASPRKVESHVSKDSTQKASPRKVESHVPKNDTTSPRQVQSQVPNNGTGSAAKSSGTAGAALSSHTSPSGQAQASPRTVEAPQQGTGWPPGVPAVPGEVPMSPVDSGAVALSPLEPGVQLTPVETGVGATWNSANGAASAAWTGSGPGPELS